MCIRDRNSACLLQEESPAGNPTESISLSSALCVSTARNPSLAAFILFQPDKSDGLISVSYTHLRQTLHALYGGMVNPILFLPEGVIGRLWIFRPKPAGRKPCLIPVSYTHLDVYKRQKQHCYNNRRKFNIQIKPICLACVKCYGYGLCEHFYDKK